MFSRRLPVVAATALLSVPTFGFTGAIADRGSDQTEAPALQPDRTLDAAIKNVSFRVVDLGLEKLPIRPFEAEKSVAAQAFYDRWAKYSKEIRAASNDGADPQALSLVQKEFLDWVRQETSKLGIPIPAEDQKLVGEFPELADQILLLRPGLRALSYHYGMVPDGCPMEVKKDPAHPESFLFIIGAPIRLYRVIECNPEPWVRTFPSLAKSDVPLVAITFMSGRDYVRSPDGGIVDKASFMSDGIVFIDLTAVESLTTQLEKANAAQFPNWLPLIDLPFERFVLSASTDKALLPKPDIDPIARLKNGGAAFDCLVALAGTDRNTHPFTWQALTGQRTGEFLMHEGAHAQQSARAQARDRLLSRLARGGVAASDKDRSEAEVLLEIGVRLESMRSSLTYPMSLLNDARAGYQFGKDFNGQAAKAAQLEIFQAIDAELRENATMWGLEFKNETVKVGGIEFSPSEQVLAQFHRFARTADSTGRMVDAVLNRIHLDARKDALAEKVGYVKPTPATKSGE